MADQAGGFQRGRGHRGKMAFIWEIKLGWLGPTDYDVSNTVGDSGKTAMIRPVVLNAMRLIYYDPSLLPYAARPNGRYPGFN